MQDMTTRDATVDAAPTFEQARLAADVLRSEGASAVLLFGSLAKGRAHAHSDLDLVAVFDDIDYDERYPQSWRLASLCRSATNKEVDVFLTDWPEWEHRTGKVGSSLEANLNRYGSWIFRNAPDADSVNWEKEIGRPKTDLEEAISHIEDINKALGGLIVHRGLYAHEIQVVDGTERVDLSVRSNRLTSLCAEAALVVEHSLKCLTALEGQTPQWSHDIEVLLKGCAAIPDSLLNALEPLRKNTLRAIDDKEYDDISCWRIASSYTHVVRLPELSAVGSLADQLSRSATVAAEATLERIEQAGADTSRENLAQCRNILRIVQSKIEELDVITGAQRTTWSDVETQSDL